MNTNNFGILANAATTPEIIWDRSCEINFGAFDPGGYGIRLSFRPWMLSDTGGIGHGTIYNTFVSISQFTTALALAKHPVVESLLVAPDSVDAQQCFDHLVEIKALNGLKMLDLGCGITPMVARTCRAMGAEVFTVDTASATAFTVDKTLADSDFAELERRHHITLDYSSAHAADTILSATNGRLFDYMTTSMAELTSGTQVPRILIEKTLQTGGLYYDAFDNLSLCIKRPSMPYRDDLKTPHPKFSGLDV